MPLPSIEFAIRSAFSWSLVRLFGGKQRVPLPDWRARPYRILFIRDDGIGDMIVSIEVLRAIAEASPTFTLDLLCSPQNATIGRSLPFVNEVIVHKRAALLKSLPTWRRLRRNGYDVAIDGRIAIRNVNKQTTCLMLSTGAPWRIGIAGRTNDRLYSVPISPRTVTHWVDNIVALAGPFGVAPDSRDWRAKLPLPSEDGAQAERAWNGVGVGRPRVLVNLYSAMSDRMWPVDRFGPVLAQIRRRLPHATIVIPTMPDGDPVANRLADPVSAGALPLNLKQLTAVTAAADLVISPDTAITVIASAFQVPVLALMRRDTQQWVPYRVPGHVAYSDDPRSLVGLPADRVVAAVDHVVDTLGRDRGWI
ncbi:MAG: glycosyltransferase family 9 protein [Gemmatimonadaceae bacterium]